MPVVKRKKTGGRPRDKVLDAYAHHYNLTRRQRHQISSYVVQLSLCQSEEARRLILGRSQSDGRR